MIGIVRKRQTACILLVITFIAMAVAIATSVRAQINPSGIVSYWKFDEGSGSTANDSVDANNGSIHEAVWVETGRVNSALSFDGSNDYVSIPDSASLDAPSVTNEITMEAWVKIATSLANGFPQHYVIDSRGGVGATGYVLNVDTELIQCLAGRPVDFPSSIEVGRWHHVVCTYDGSEMIVYVDGVVMGNYSHTLPILPSNGTLYIGQRFNHVERFKGMIDEVAIWDRALAQEEVQQHYQNGLNGHGYDYVPALQATIDLDPDTLNLNSNGQWVTAYIELPDGHDVNDINISSVNLTVAGNMVPVDANAPTMTGDYDSDGVPDLMVKFDRSTVIDHLGTTDTDDEGTEIDYEIVILTIMGELTNGVQFEGSDTVRVIEKGKK